MNILLITPPLTQLNTPYPGTLYLTGFLKSKGYTVSQYDLGIELINCLFTSEMLEKVFEEAGQTLTKKAPQNVRHIFSQKDRYIHTISAVMHYLHGDQTLATRICNDNFLPQASRFESMADLDWVFGNLGLSDRARYLATLYLEDITDFIRGTIDPYFDLGRYAEHLSLHMPQFAPLEQALRRETNPVDSLMLRLLGEKVQQVSPDAVGFCIPFPGNLYGALKCCQFLKQQFPAIKLVWGGGYVNTELRQLTEPKIFDYTDYILFDDGELPFLRLIEVWEGKKETGDLIRTKLRDGSGQIVSIGWENQERVPFAESCAPDYSGLALEKYISLIETANPMHKLWSDGRWNKLILARGCYWAKCAFCDTSLPYISCFEPGDATRLADHMEAMIKQTGITGFHFVDEAAPPRILRELSEEIIRRNLTVSWWTNIRFEKAFTPELCALLEKAGCIAVSGGIEVASNRLLKLMNKGVTIEQTTVCANNLTNSNIMVHAYLMYGFPTQTLQETIDALEYIRQMFGQGLIQSAFWHRYAMTVHSPSGKNPLHFRAKHLDCPEGTFANNEIPFTDGQEINLDMIGQGLRKATFNYMNGLCIDWPVYKWFEEKVPKTKVIHNYISEVIREE
jgi:hypothetical protein